MLLYLPSKYVIATEYVQNNFIVIFLNSDFSGPQKDLKPSVQRDVSVRGAAEWAAFQEAAFLRVRLRPLLQTWPDRPGSGGQPAGLQRGQRGQARLEGHRGGHRGKSAADEAEPGMEHIKKENNTSNSFCSRFEVERCASMVWKLIWFVSRKK